MRGRQLTWTIFSGLALAAVIGLPSAPSRAANLAAEIEKVKAATAKYQDVKAALADGYIPAPPGDCVTAEMEGMPKEMGAMGIHYIHPGMLKITATEPEVDGGGTHTDFMKPAILIYEPQADGSLELVAAENLVFEAAWKAAGNTEPPSFAGRSFDHMVDDPATPVHEAHHFKPHYDQHVYFRAHDKPEDQLKPFTTKVTCEHFKK